MYYTVYILFVIIYLTVVSNQWTAKVFFKYSKNKIIIVIIVIKQKNKQKCFTLILNVKYELVFRLLIMKNLNEI